MSVSILWVLFLVYFLCKINIQEVNIESDFFNFKGSIAKESYSIFFKATRKK